MNPPAPVTSTRRCAIGCLPFSVRLVIAAEHEWDRLEQQPTIPPQRPGRDVDVVELDHLRERDLVPAEHLPETGHPGLQIEPLAAPPIDELVLVENQWTRADQAHLPEKHVDQLGQLVERIS